MGLIFTSLTQDQAREHITFHNMIFFCSQKLYWAFFAFLLQYDFITNLWFLSPVGLFWHFHLPDFSLVLHTYIFWIIFFRCVTLNISKLDPLLLFFYPFLPPIPSVSPFFCLLWCSQPFTMIRRAVLWYCFIKYSTKITVNYYTIY